jgi:hypothetical protein
MEIQKAYKQKMAAQLAEWGAQVDLLEAKVVNTGADLEIKRIKELHELREKLLVASEKMNEYEKMTGEAWNEVKVAADKVWYDIKAGVAAAHEKLIKRV